MKLPEKKIILLAGAILAVFLLLLSLFLVTRGQPVTEPVTNTGRLSQNGNQSPSPVKPQVIALPTAIPVPKIEFAQLENTANTPTVPQDLKLYNFRTDFQPDEVLAIGKKLGLEKIRQSGKSVIVYNLDDSLSRGYLQFDLSNGSYSFRSYGAFPSNISVGQAKNEAVRMYLSNLGLIDRTVNCPVTYQRKEISGVTFVECHRDWQSAGLPIMNFIGLLNAPQDKALSDIRLGETDSNTPTDESIVQTSTSQDGKKRPDDFNTVTVAIDDNGEILSITSNLRQIASVKEVPADNLISSDDALAQFKAGNAQGQLSFVAPENYQGNLAEIYSGKKSLTLNAQITDFLLVYLEHPTAAKQLLPTYLVRGNATLSSGTPVVFLQAIPAVKYQLSDISDTYRISSLSNRGQVAGIYTTPEAEGLKLNTFNPDQAPEPTIAPSDCVPAENQLSPLVALGSYGMVGPFTINAQGQKRAGNWFLIPQNKTNLPEINTVTAQFDSLSLEGKKAELREIDKLNKEWALATVCPLRLTGGSPTLFVYGPEGQTSEIGVGRQLTYAYPFQSGNNWKITFSGNQLLIGGKEYASIYYEYKPLNFARPENGWNIEKKDIDSFVKNTISGNLKLTPIEEKGLLFEITHAAGPLAEGKIFIGLIPQEKVDNLLPLIASPEPENILRYHFFVAESDGSSVSAPLLTPVKRSPSMILEFGATR